MTRKEICTERANKRRKQGKSHYSDKIRLERSKKMKQEYMENNKC